MKKILFTCAVIIATITSSSAQQFELIKETDGMVGINLGTSPPITTLDVGGNIYSRGALHSVVSGTDIGGRLVLLNPAKPTGAASNWTIYNMGGAYGNSLQFWSYDNTGCAGGMCAQRLVLMDNGNVGIGVSAPTAKLAVAGGIAATRIKVTQNPAIWPDYVFEPSYQLPSLYELEQFIRKNKHLPDVPSAATVATDGLDLGENQATLLKKIEELTLYVIELKKEVDDLKKDVKGRK